MLEKQRKYESVIKYITHWYNLSMKCKQLEEDRIIQLLMGNINDKMTPYLCMNFINTFKELLDRVAKFEKLNLLRSERNHDRS